MSFTVYDSYGNCISEYTGTLREWQQDVAAKLSALPAVPPPGHAPPMTRLN